MYAIYYNVLEVILIVLVFLFVVLVGMALTYLGTLVYDEFKFALEEDRKRRKKIKREDDYFFTHWVADQRDYLRNRAPLY